MSYQIKIPSCVYGGEGCIEHVNAIIKKEDSKKIIIFTDKGIREHGLLDILTNLLDETNTQYRVYDSLTPEPAYQDAERVMKEVEDYDGDLIIAIGGGSVMDVAKLCSVLKGANTP